MLYLIRNNTVKLNIQWVTSSKPNWRHFWNTRYGFDCCHFLNHSWWVNKGPPAPTVRTVLNKCQCPSIIQFSNQSPTQETCVDSVLILYKWIFALVLCLCTCSSCDCLLSPPAPRCLTALPVKLLFPNAFQWASTILYSDFRYLWPAQSLLPVKSDARLKTCIS